MAVGQWVAPLLFEFRQLASGLYSGHCAGTPWGAILLCILLSFLCGCCCGGLAACIALSSACRRFAFGLGRALLEELGGLQPLRLTAEQRLAEYRQHRA